MDNHYLLETRNLKKYFPAGAGRTLHALDGVNLRIQPGRTLGVVGESGCGKSTLGKTILRLTEPTDGQIFLNGQEITAMSKAELRKLRRKMQLIFQDPYASLNPRMTVEDSIAEPMLVNKMFKTRGKAYGRVDELMELVGLAPRNASLFPHEISGGLRQRVGIARALATNPEFIVCDEPVSALDVSIQAQILNLLMDLQDQLHISYLFIFPRPERGQAYFPRCGGDVSGTVCGKRSDKGNFPPSAASLHPDAAGRHSDAHPGGPRKRTPDHPWRGGQSH